VLCVLYAAVVLGWYWWTLRSPMAMAISLTAWTQAIVLIYFVTAIVQSAMQVRGTVSGSIGESGSASATFLLFETALTFSLVSVVMYWATEFPATHTGAAAKTTADVVWAVHAHGISVVLCLSDLLLSRVRPEFFHYLTGCSLAMGYALCYGLLIRPSASVLSSLLFNSLITLLIIFAVALSVVLSFLLIVAMAAARDVCHANSTGNAPVVFAAGHEDRDAAPGKARDSGLFAGVSFSI